MWTPRSLRSFVRRSEERRTRNAGHTTFTGIIAGSNEILLLHSRRPIPTQNQERIFKKVKNRTEYHGGWMDAELTDERRRVDRSALPQRISHKKKRENAFLAAWKFGFCRPGG